MKGLLKIIAPVIGTSVLITNMMASTVVPTGSCLNQAPVVYEDSTDTKLDVGAFVNRCYEVALGRGADNDGYKYWVDSLNNGQACGAQVGYGFIFSSEYIGKNTDDAQFIKDLYKMYFDREPDNDGFNYWMDFLSSGLDREFVFAGFANSTEFYNLCNKYNVVAGYYLVGMPNDQQGGVNCFVSRLYKACLNRLPDQASQSSFVVQLTEGEITGADLAKLFIFSAELANRNLTNEEFVKVMYDAFFGREADTEGLNVWTEKLNGSVSKNLIFNGFANSAEFDNLCNSYGITRGTVGVEEYPSEGENAFGHNDRLISYMTKNVIRMEDIEVTNEAITCANANYIDPSNGSVLTAASSGYDDLSFLYNVDPMGTFYMLLNMATDSTYVLCSFSLAYGGDFAWPVNINCPAKDLDEVIANLYNPEYYVGGVYQIKDAVEYDPSFDLQTLSLYKADIDLTYASFIKAYENALKYWGTSNDVIGLPIGNIYSSYPTNGTLSMDNRNGMTTHTFVNGKATDADITWEEYLISIAKGDESSELDEYSATTPVYPLNSAENSSAICSGNESLESYITWRYIGCNPDDSYSDWNINIYPDSDEIVVNALFEYDMVSKIGPDGYPYFAPTNTCYVTFSCSRSELGKICSSASLLSQTASISFGMDNKVDFTETQVINIFLREYPNVIASFEYDLNYYSTSLADGGIIK